MSMHHAETRRILEKRRLSRRTDLNDNTKAYVRPAPGLSSPASPNSNGNRLTAQSNCIWLARFNLHSIRQNIGLCVFERFRSIRIFKECVRMDSNFYFERNIKWCHHSTPLLQDHSLPGSLCSHTCWLRPEPIFMRFDPKLRSVKASGI